jgi:hypothetical protein
MSASNVLWGARRLHGELLKLGIDVSQTPVAKYMVKHRKPPSQTWRTFLENHVKQLVSVDFFVVPTLSFRILYVFLILAHDRRRIVHFNVTEHPTAEWSAAQLLHAFPWDMAPRFLLRDRDSIYGAAFRTQAKTMEIREVLTAFRSQSRLKSRHIKNFLPERIRLVQDRLRETASQRPQAAIFFPSPQNPTRLLTICCFRYRFNRLVLSRSSF